MEQHVAQGGTHVARQRGLVAELKRDGHDLEDALELLKTFESLQSQHIEHRNH